MNAGSTAVSQSLVSWVIHSLGYPAIIFLVASATFSLLLTIFLTWRGRGAMAAVALMLAVHIPFLTGIVMALVGTLQAFTVVAASASAPKPSELAEGISMSLVAPLVGLLLMVPGYTIALGGSMLRAVYGSNDAGFPNAASEN